MEVLRTALLVTPSTHPIRKLIEEPKEHSVDACPFDILSPAAGWNHILNGKGTERPMTRPILLVSTLANTRGLGLPDLSHVFVTRVPEGRIGSYTHIAGWMDRFGKTKRIVTVVEKIEEEVDDGMGGRKRRVVKDEENKMMGILREVRIIR